MGRGLVDDVLLAAWLVLRRHSDKVLSAARPWAYLMSSAQIAGRWTSGTGRGMWPRSRRPAGRARSSAGSTGWSAPGIDHAGECTVAGQLRHPRHDLAGVAERLREVFTEPAPLMAGAETLGDPMAVLPVLFHLLWRHELIVDVSVPLHPSTLVSSRGAA